MEGSDTIPRTGAGTACLVGPFCEIKISQRQPSFAPPAPPWGLTGGQRKRSPEGHSCPRIDVEGTTGCMARLQAGASPGVTHGVSHPSSAGPIGLTPSRGTDTKIAALDAGSRGMEWDHVRHRETLVDGLGRSQNLVSARTWGFDSPSRHHRYYPDDHRRERTRRREAIA